MIVDRFLMMVWIGLLCSEFSGTQVHAEEISIVIDDFQSATKQWLWHGDVKSGELILTAFNDAKYNGVQTLLKPHIAISADNGSATHIHLKINGISDVQGKEVMADARLFIVPDPLRNATFADPYSDPNALTILLSANGAKGTLKVNLFRKSNQVEPGYGVLLYSGVLSMQSFPLTLDWYLSRSAYKLKVEPGAQTVDGAKQGTYELTKPWDGELRYIMRIVNLSEGVKAQMRISDFSISTAPIPE